ncbi:hypothetical protein Q8A73_007419 [Channa argus]|nr:hypothetical protein Q8A73_007419 [Channa argus]
MLILAYITQQGGDRVSAGLCGGKHHIQAATYSAVIVRLQQKTISAQDTFLLFPRLPSVNQSFPSNICHIGVAQFTSPSFFINFAFFPPDCRTPRGVWDNCAAKIIQVDSVCVCVCARVRVGDAVEKPLRSDRVAADAAPSASPSLPSAEGEVPQVQSWIRALRGALKPQIRN